jgi:dTDP-4-dehydrorhamnose reductase
MKRILIIGSTSCLAKEIIRALNNKKSFFKVLKISRKNFDYINNNKKITFLIRKFKPNFIINCSSFNGFVKCNNSLKDAYLINTFFLLNLAETSINCKCKLIHFSTDAVFKGNIKNKLYSEFDFPDPITVYGKSKYMGEEILLKYKNTMIIRLPLLFGPTHKSQIINKLVNNVLKKKIIKCSNDIYCTPVYSPSVANYVLENILLNNNNNRIIHLTSKKLMSLFSFIRYLFRNQKKYLDNIISVDSSYFKKSLIKPKYLGLKSIFKSSYIDISSITYRNILN